MRIMKSLDVCDSTQNDDDKESGKQTKGQEGKENGKEDGSKSVNGEGEDKELKIVIKSEPLENESNGCLETGAENNAFELDSNGNLENLNRETDETIPTSTDEGSSNGLSVAGLNSSETNCEKECENTCRVVSDSITCGKKPDGNLEMEESNGRISEELQKLKTEPMDVDSASATEDPYKDVNSILESPMERLKEEKRCGDDTAIDKDVGNEECFDMDEDTILDLDCDKENEKNVEDGEVDGFSKADKHETQVSLEGSTNECEIRVGECQTISGPDKDFLWSEPESKKSQDSEENLEAPIVNESDSIPRSNEEETGDKEGDKCSGEDEVVAETAENEKGDESNVTKSGSGKATEEDMDESYANKTDTESEDGKCSPTSLQAESVGSRKRKTSKENESAPESKKKKSGNDDVATKLVSEGKSVTDSSPSKSPSNLDVESPTVARSSSSSSSSANHCGAERASKKRASVDDANAKKSKTSGEETERSTTQEIVDSSFLTSLRGTLKNLTRSDLEELIVQKLCEAITERSNVGELRRKAQALEEDQERWRNKVQSLTKQMREMEMVMKKYMSEVQKQVKENSSQVVTPIKVTRSVGLQVSFYSSSSRQPKPGLSPNASNTAQNANAKNAKATPAKLLPNYTSVPGAKNKSAPSPQKALLPPPKTPPSQSKKTVTTRSDSGSLPPPKGPAPSVVNSNRIIQGQLPGPGIKISYKPPSAVQLPQQNGSKVIDLTEDDDKQPGSVAKPQSPIRVVNHLSQQPQIQANARFAYFVPKTNSQGTGTSSGQNRQVLIATPAVSQQNRPLMCPMPPLLFKGGNVPPGSQPQTQSPNNRVILPKTLRHPAPLPLPPSNPVSRKNMKLLPPRPALKISKVQTGIVLSWNMTLGPEHAPISSYQLYAYQESNSPPTTSLWKKVGDVKALPLPMACTLTQFMSGHKYHFAVRAVDHHCRLGPFSFPGTIVLVK